MSEKGPVRKQLAYFVPFLLLLLPFAFFAETAIAVDNEEEPEGIWQFFSQPAFEDFSVCYSTEKFSRLDGLFETTETGLTRSKDFFRTFREGSAETSGKSTKFRIEFISTDQNLYARRTDAALHLNGSYRRASSPNEWVMHTKTLGNVFGAFADGTRPWSKSAAASNSFKISTDPESHVVLESAFTPLYPKDAKSRNLRISFAKSTDERISFLPAEIKVYDVTNATIWDEFEFSIQENTLIPRKFRMQYISYSPGGEAKIFEYYDVYTIKEFRSPAKKSDLEFTFSVPDNSSIEVADVPVPCIYRNGRIEFFNVVEPAPNVFRSPSLWNRWLPLIALICIALVVAFVAFRSWRHGNSR
jgi:hypothetical protein